MPLGAIPAAPGLSRVPPLPQGERYAMTDADLMAALDPAHSAAAP